VLQKSILVILLLFSYSMIIADLKDFGFKPMHQKIRYKEDFFRLYNQWLYADLDSVSRNIYFLELAYVVPFDHPIKALTPITNEQQYERYKNLLMMHICRLLTQEYINYGYMYMKENIYFYNEEFIKEYLDGYEIAEYYFNHARSYWEQAIKYAEDADTLWEHKIDLLFLEDELYKIKMGDLDYYKVVSNLMERIQKNRKRIESLSSSLK